MSDEQILIECAKLTSSAAVKPQGNVEQHEAPDEDSLIAAAVLSNSEMDQKLDKPEHSGNIPKIIINTYEGEEDDVFDDADDDNSGTEVSIELNRVQILPNFPSEDHRRIQLTEDILITYAHLSDNELREMTKDNIKETFEDINVERVQIPKLDIGNFSDDNAYESDKDGYKTPVNSEQGDEPKADNVDDRKQKRIRINESVSPGRSLFAEANYTNMDGEFNALVIDTANAMNTLEFEDIKSMFQGTEGFEIFPNMDSPILFLNHLQRYKVISPDNLHHIQMIVARLRNPLLHLRARHYIKQRSQTVFFHPETSYVLPGFDTFKCHISGKDFTRLQRNDLETVRSAVSLLLFIPPNSVYIVGIEPGINLVISLMIPQRYIGTLMKMASVGLPELGSIGVDLVQISGRTMKTQGFITTLTSSNDHMKFLTVYQQMRDKNLQLEERDREISEMKEEIEFIKLELETKNAELDMLAQKSDYDSLHRPDRHRQPVRRRRSLPMMAPDSVLKTAVPVAKQSTKRSFKISEPGVKVKEEREDTGRRKENRLDDPDGTARGHSQTVWKKGNQGRHVDAEPHGFQWTRDDISALTSVRHVIERGEIMDEIEAILSELGFSSK